MEPSEASHADPARDPVHGPDPAVTGMSSQAGQGGSPPGTGPDAGAVAAALGSLGCEHRQVIIHTFYGHLSEKAAASRLGIPVRDVRRRARWALHELRDVLEERGLPVPRQPGPSAGGLGCVTVETDVNHPGEPGRKRECPVSRDWA